MIQKNTSAKNVLFNSSIYSITSFLQKGINFILIPLYTYYLTPTDYGIVGIVNSIIQVLSLLYTLSLNSAIQRYYHKYKNDRLKLQEFNGTIIVFILINSIIMSSIIILFKEFLIEPFIDGVSFYPYIFLGVVSIVFNPVYTIYQTLLQTMEDAKSYSKNSLLYFASSLILSVVFIVYFGLSAVGQLMATLIVSVVFGLFAVFSLYKRKIIRFRFNFTHLKEALRYSVPLIPHLMSSQIANLVSRIFLNNQISTASAGLYNMAAQIITVIDTIQGSVNNAYVPWFYRLMDLGKSAHNEIIKFANMTSKLYLVLNLAFAFFIKEVLIIFTPVNYHPAWMYIPLLVIAYQIRTIYFYYVNTLFYNTKATKVIFISTMSGSLINVIFSALFTDTVGFLTPGIALILQQLFTSIVVVFLSKKYEPVNFNLKNMVLDVLLLIFSLVIGLMPDLRYYQTTLNMGTFFYKLIIFFTVLFISLRQYNSIIKSFLKKIFKKMK